ncbi:hypothetical protein HBB16_14215 [Pseudonocardia sp. MCCB 268]|nr:hypothetical protein [Pseudonocardia cytotoxica]
MTDDDARRSSVLARRPASTPWSTLVIDPGREALSLTSCQSETLSRSAPRSRTPTCRRQPCASRPAEWVG